MRQEVIRKIIMILKKYDINEREISNKLQVILNDYEITARETQICVRHEDKNQLFMQKFLVAKAVSGRTERTLDFYKKTLVFIFNRICKPADEVTTDDIRYYLAKRQTKDGISTVSANNELRVLKSFYTFLLSEELVAKNPCLKIEKIKQEKHKKEAFKEIEIEMIRNHCRTNREKAIVEILLSTGCRVSELVNIKIADIKNDSLIVHGKGKKDRTVYLNAKSILALQLYLQEREDDNPFLFASGDYDSAKYCKVKENWYKEARFVTDKHADKGTIEAAVRRIGKRAGVEKVHPHRFRRTCATYALRRGMPIEQVSKMLGHNSIDTTMIYLDLSEDELHQAHKKYVV